MAELVGHNKVLGVMVRGTAGRIRRAACRHVQNGLEVAHQCETGRERWKMSMQLSTRYRRVDVLMSCHDRVRVCFNPGIKDKISSA